MGKTRTTPDFYQIFQLAEQYSKASIVLDEASKGNEDQWSSPRMMVDSFAVELYLKCLFVIDLNAPPWGHDWKKLFDELKPYTRTAIRDEFNRIVNSHPVLRNLDVINPEALKMTDFDLSLKVAKNTFDKGRYTYDSELPRGWFYTHLIREAIRSFANMVVPIEQAKRESSTTT